MKLKVNGTLRTIRSSRDTPLLWVLRDELKLKGTKFGCGVAECGCCTVLVDGEATLSCVNPVGDVEGEVVTIEGLGSPEAPHPLQEAWLRHDVMQCGYCQPGQLMAAAALLASDPSPSRVVIDEAMKNNLCRCGTYPRIRTAIASAAAATQVRSGSASAPAGASTSAPAGAPSSAQSSTPSSASGAEPESVSAPAAPGGER